MQLTKRDGLPSKFWKIFPHPVPSSLALDILYICELLVLQDYVIPQLFAHKVFIDLLTPWLLIIFVFRPAWRMLLLAALSILLLETHSGLPGGIFVCFYWVLGVGLYFSRHNISWASFLPWGVLFFVSQVFLIVLESISFWILNYSSLFYLGASFSHNLLNGFLSCFFGLFIIYKSRLDTLEEQRLARN